MVRCVLSLCAVLGVVCGAKAASSKLNVLMIAVDDLRDSPASEDAWVTPNFDSFKKDALYLRSYVQQAVCGASRTSILTGRRPDTTHMYDLVTYFRDTGCADCQTIPQLFGAEGYRTYGVGKIFHPGSACGGNETDYQSWTEPYVYSVQDGDYYEDLDDMQQSWMAISAEDEADVPLEDTANVNYALEVLRNVTADTYDSPWFLAVGLHKPHLPFIFPERFLDVYPENETTLALNPFAPADLPAVAYASWELENWLDVKATNFTGQINQTLVDWKALEERRAYAASVSYTDENLGLLLTELKTLGAWETTIVLLWSDHGYKLGDHGAWCKHTNFNTDTVAPVYFRVPGLTDGGVDLSRTALVEHVDIMPSLVEAAGLRPLALCPEQEPWKTARCTEGASFLELATAKVETLKNASFSQYPRTFATGWIMGYSMTTSEALRFTAWVEFNTTTNTTDWSMNDSNCAFELYNHTADPQENANLAYKESMSETVDELFAVLKRGWRDSLP